MEDFDTGVVKKWDELASEQRTEFKKLGIPYFEEDDDSENRRKMLAFLEDLIEGDE